MNARELHVDDAVGGHGAVSRAVDRAVEPVDEVLGELGGAPRRSTVVVAREAAQRRDAATRATR